MFHKYFATAFLGMLLIAGCAPKVRTNISQKYPALNFDEDVLRIPDQTKAPEGAELLGEVRVGDSGVTTNCSYALVLEKAKEEARKSGGNAIRVIEHKKPDLMSSCHRIIAEVFRLSWDQALGLQQDDTKTDSLIDHAILYVYRDGGRGAFVSYNLNLGDSVICRVSNRFRQKIEIRNEGNYELWAKTESKASVPIKFVIGRTYYLRCGVGMGILLGRPTLDLVDRVTGEREYSGRFR